MNNSNRYPHTLLTIKRKFKLSDFGNLYPFSGISYDMDETGYVADVTKSLILINIGSDFRNKFNEVLFVCPELNLN